MKQLESAGQITSAQEIKHYPFNSLVSVYHFFSPLEGISLEMITSDNRSQLIILDILLIFVYVFKSHLDSGMIQGKDHYFTVLK